MKAHHRTGTSIDVAIGYAAYSEKSMISYCWIEGHVKHVATRAIHLQKFLRLHIPQTYIAGCVEALVTARIGAEPCK